MTGSREELEYLLEIKSVRATVSLTTRNTRCNLYKIEESLR